MILFIRQYLALLRERDELDAILPDLLSQMGLVVFSRPRRGTRQNGVDVGAVGRIGDGEEKVYLFSIKAGDLTRSDWEGTSQALRSSLIQILEVYIRNRLPVEHRDKSVVVCICLGGVVREEVRDDLTAFIDKHKSSTVSFEEWHGDKLASEIQRVLLREELLPLGARSNLRKALALLDEPQSSFAHFRALIRSLAAPQSASTATQVMAFRQMNLCLRILFAWCRDAGNSEAAFLSAELTLLHSWVILREFLAKQSRETKKVLAPFLSIYDAYQEICGGFLKEYVVPHAAKPHGLSSAVGSSCSLDVNLKLFDLIGRVGVTGLWAFWTANRTGEEQSEERAQMLEQTERLAKVVKAMVINNPALLLPATEHQSIDVALALLLLGLDGRNADDIRVWLREMVNRADFALRSHSAYPCTLTSYIELLEHPMRQDDDYRKKVTAGSVLFPLIALWAALLGDHEVYSEVAELRREVLDHCTFQCWYPDETSEARLYTGDQPHGATLSNVCVDRTESALLDQLFFECDATSHFEELTAVKYGWWPIVAVACRHHRFPLPLHLLKPLRPQRDGNAGGGVSST